MAVYRLGFDSLTMLIGLSRRQHLTQGRWKMRNYVVVILAGDDDTTVCGPMTYEQAVEYKAEMEAMSGGIPVIMTTLFDPFPPSHITPDWDKA